MLKMEVHHGKASNKELLAGPNLILQPSTLHDCCRAGITLQQQEACQSHVTAQGTECLLPGPQVEGYECFCGWDYLLL